MILKGGRLGPRLRGRKPAVVGSSQNVSSCVKLSTFKLTLKHILSWPTVATQPADKADPFHAGSYAQFLSGRKTLSKYDRR